MSNPSIFIVGCPRSGTTLLQLVVNAHPEIAVMPEAPWIYRFPKRRVGITPEGAVTADLIPALLEHPKFAPLGITRSDLLSLIGDNQRPTYSAFVERIFDLYGKMQSKDLVGNKTPALVRRLELVHELWPEARIVHLIRDGRDVFLSIKNRGLHHRNSGVGISRTEDPVSTIGLWWELNVQMGRKAGRTLGPGLYYEVLYERLVKNPTDACADLCAFLGVPYRNAMLRFYESGKTQKASLPITPCLRDWRSQMPPEEVEVFESAAGRTLYDLCYPRAFPHPHPELVDRSLRKRALLLAQSRRYARAFEGVAAKP
jgi:hypothetical protein